MNIALITTKSLTIEKFLLPFVGICASNNDSLVLLCNNARKLKEEKHISGDVGIFDVNFPDSWSEILNPWFMLSVLYRTRRFLNSHKGYVFYIHTPVASHIVRISSLFLKIKIVYHVHGFRFHDQGRVLKNYFSEKVELVLSKATTKFITINKDDYKFVCNRIKKSVNLIHGVGVDTNKLIKIAKNKKIKNSKIIIGVVGAYKIEKGYDDIINLIKVLDTDIEIEIHCYGYGDKSLIRSRVENRKINQVGIFFHDFSDNILNIISGFDLLIHPSRREGLPVSIMEAMCLGIPIIATNIRGCRDLINDKIDGRLYTPKDVRALNAILGDFLKNKGKYNNYAKLAQSKCIKNFNAKEKAKDMYSVVGDVYES